jgi:pyruvate ferredoxin oxidoreductase beta subunit
LWHATGRWAKKIRGRPRYFGRGSHDVALDVLIAEGRLTAAEDLQVVVPADEGAALDIGLSSLSGAIHRGLDSPG